MLHTCRVKSAGKHPLMQLQTYDQLICRPLDPPVQIDAGCSSSELTCSLSDIPTSRLLSCFLPPLLSSKVAMQHLRNPRTPQQRIEKWPLHQSPPPSRPRRLQRLRLQQPRRPIHRSHYHRPPAALPQRQAALLRPLMPTIPIRNLQQHFLAAPN